MKQMIDLFVFQMHRPSFFGKQAIVVAAGAGAGAPPMQSGVVSCTLHPMPNRDSTTDEGYLYVIDHLIKPILDDWKPEWLVVANEGGDAYIYDSSQDCILLTERGLGG